MQARTKKGNENLQDGRKSSVNACAYASVTG